MKQFLHFVERQNVQIFSFSCDKNKTDGKHVLLEGNKNCKELIELVSINLCTVFHKNVPFYETACKKVIGCLHDEANMKQTWSKCIEYTRARHVL